MFESFLVWDERVFQKYIESFGRLQAKRWNVGSSGNTSEEGGKANKGTIFERQFKMK